MVREVEDPLATHAQKRNWILTNKCGNNLIHKNEPEGPSLTLSYTG